VSTIGEKKVQQQKLTISGWLSFAAKYEGGLFDWFHIPRCRQDPGGSEHSLIGAGENHIHFQNKTTRYLQPGLFYGNICTSFILANRTF